MNESVVDKLSRARDEYGNMSFVNLSAFCIGQHVTVTRGEVVFDGYVKEIHFNMLPGPTYVVSTIEEDLSVNAQFDSIEAHEDGRYIEFSG